jgi:mediator of RNA polymerase II transcription subunit 7
MADSQQTLPIAPFPGPPPFWKNFSRANLTHLSTLKTEATDNSTPLDLKSLPIELRYLLPPPVPTTSTETYPTFHLTHLTSPTSPLSATTHLPPADLAALLIVPTLTTPIPAALRSLTNSLLLTFLQLTELLGQDPMHESRFELLEHIKRVFVNIHVLINSYRPHQAREGVVNMLRERIEDARGEIREAGVLKERVEGFLREVREGQGQDGLGKGNVSKVTREEEQNKRMWSMIREVGLTDAAIQEG